MNAPEDDPQVAKMDVAVMQRLFQILARARRQPTSFGVDVKSDEGIGVIRVLAVDDVVYQQKILPVLVAQGIPVTNVPK